MTPGQSSEHRSLSEVQRWIEGPCQTIASPPALWPRPLSIGRILTSNSNHAYQPDHKPTTRACDQPHVFLIRYTNRLVRWLYSQRKGESMRPHLCMRVILVLVAASLPSSGLAAVDFDTQIIPVMTKAGCNSGACHGAAVGRGGFKLSLYGSDPALDYQAIVHELEGRRGQSQQAGIKPGTAQADSIAVARRRHTFRLGEPGCRAIPAVARFGCATDEPASTG